MLLLLDVVRGVGRLRLGQLLLGAFDQRLLRGDVLLRHGLLRQRQLLRGLVDGVLGGLDVLVLRASDELIEVRLVGDQLLARGVDLRLRRLALRVERAVLRGVQARLGDDELVLAAVSWLWAWSCCA